MLIPSITGHYTLTVNPNTKVSPSTESVPVVNRVCRSVDIFNECLFFLLILVNVINQNIFQFCISFSYFIVLYDVFRFSVCVYLAFQLLRSALITEFNRIISSSNKQHSVTPLFPTQRMTDCVGNETDTTADLPTVCSLYTILIKRFAVSDES
jgi:hypothetical protein